MSSVMKHKTILSKEKLKVLMHRYYAGENNLELIEEFSLDVLVNEIHTLFPLIDRHDLSCPYCEISLKQKPLSKSAQKNGLSNNKAYCEKCGHINIDNCQCDACKRLRVKKTVEENEFKKDFLLSIRRPKLSSVIDFSVLSLRHALSLVSLARVAGDEVSDLIKPAVSHSLSFCVRKSTTLEILEELYDDGLIEIFIGSDFRAIDLSDKSKPVVNMDLLGWQFRLGNDSDENLLAIEILERMLRKKEEWPSTWENELIDIWKELALEEVFAYLELKLIEHRFTPRIGDKTKKVFLTLLQDYPISKIYNFIWASVTNATAYQVRAGISKQQAANTVIGNCQKRAEKALAENWQIKDYKKDYKIPDSMRVSVYSNVVTHLGDSFFTAPPSQD